MSADDVDREEFVKKHRKRLVEEFGITAKEKQDEEIERLWQMRAKTEAPPTFNAIDNTDEGIIKLPQKLSQAQARALGATFITVAVDDESSLPVYVYQNSRTAIQKAVHASKRGGGKPVTTVELPPQMMMPKKHKASTEDSGSDSDDEDKIIRQVTKRIKKRMKTETVRSVLVEFGEDPRGPRNVVAGRLAEQMYLESASEGEDDGEDDP
jgi:hypothetical protein